MKSKKYCVILFIFIVVACITCGISMRAISVYSVYNENYRDTVYIEIKQPKPKFKTYEFPGKPSGIIQSGYIKGTKRYITIRRFDNSELEDIRVGGYDYSVMEIGDTIIGKTNEN